MGAATAEKIIAGRPYASVADLAKAGVPAKTIEKITPLVAIGAAAVSTPVQPGATKQTMGTAAAVPATGAAAPIDINGASQKDLESLPGVGAATAEKIIAGRPYASVPDLAKAGVPAKTIERITPLVTVGRAPINASSGSAAAGSTAPGAASSATAQVPPAAGMVWVNLSTKVYHYPGDQWYGKTKSGKFMTEQEAIAAGFHASKEKPKKTP